MAFRIVHELEGAFADSDGTLCRFRMRCRCGQRLSLEEAQCLADGLDAVDGVIGVEVNPTVGSVLFYCRD